ncbi:MAG TPA: AcsC protein, partial [Acinetobacter radioresistens]|nr:AcsC protein [Acinetobacter radioresistens]
LDFAILREVHATAVDFTKLPASHARQAYGTIGSLWRESIHHYLKPGEDAIPLNGISHVQNDGQLLIQPWLDAHGTEAWLTQFLSVVIQPILFLLHAEGIGSESHGQNIILLHQNGWPTR